ncbi:MAG: YdeI/OmpD-associated family protein [Acidimicrobiales bacterium]
MANPEIDAYVARSDMWPDEIGALRPILRECGLTEELKWGKPCYSLGGKNIVILQEMKQFLALMFFKGALLRDAEGVLEAQGPNSRSARRMCFTSVDEVVGSARTVAAYVEEAIAVEEAGLEPMPAPELVPVEELQVRFDDDPILKEAFEALTPGRQREYHLHFSSAKQAATRAARVEKCVPKILDGKGFRDR